MFFFISNILRTWLWQCLFPAASLLFFVESFLIWVRLAYSFYLDSAQLWKSRHIVYHSLLHLLFLTSRCWITMEIEILQPWYCLGSASAEILAFLLNFSKTLNWLKWKTMKCYSNYLSFVLFSGVLLVYIPLLCMKTLFFTFICMHFYAGYFNHACWSNSWFL